MLTKFGKELRKIRIDHGEVLRDTAERLGVSSSFLSAVESGKKNIPADWIPRLAEMYHLDAKETKNLEAAAQESVVSLKIMLSTAGERQRKAAIVFARDFETMSEDQANRILALFPSESLKE